MLGARRISRLLLLTALVCLTSAAAANAASVSFVAQFHPASLPEGTALTLTGDHLTSFSVLLRPTACAGPANWQTDSDDVFQLTIAPSAGVTLSGGSFSYSGIATSAYYNGGYGAPFGGQFTVSATVNPAHTVVTGSVTLTGAHDPFVKGCSGSYNFIAIPDVNVTRKLPDKKAYQSQFVSFDYAGGVIRNLQVQSNFICGQSVDSAQFNGAAYGYATIQTLTNGTFRVQTYVLDEYKEILSLTVTGRVTGKTAHGRIVVSEPPGGYELIGSVGVCHGNYGWTASRPVPPPPPGPTAFFQWGAIRIPVGTTYHYYFAITSLSCTDHANEVRITIAGRTITVSCSRRDAFASGPLAPSRNYTATVQALEVRHGRAVKRGVPATVPLQMPGPGDTWVVITGLPGTPPS